MRKCMVWSCAHARAYIWLLVASHAHDDDDDDVVVHCLGLGDQFIYIFFFGAQFSDDVVAAVVVAVT